MFDLIENYLSDNLIKTLQERKVICWNNGEPEKLRIIKGDYTSFQVPKLITRIRYPPNRDREYSMTVYIHFIEYKINKIVEDEGIKIRDIEDYKKLYNQVIEENKLFSEVERFYHNFTRREDFKHARRSGNVRKR